MIKMLIDRLDPVIRDIIIEKYTAAELVDLLNVDTAAVVDFLEQDIIDKLSSIKEDIGMDEDNDEQQDY